MLVDIVYRMGICIMPSCGSFRQRGYAGAHILSKRAEKAFWSPTIISISFDAIDGDNVAATVHSRRLAQGMSSLGHKVELVAAGQHNDEASISDDLMIVHVRTPSLAGSLVTKLASLVRKNIALYNVAKRNATQVSMVYERHNSGSIAGLLIAKRFNKPLYYEVNSVNSEEAMDIHGINNRSVRTLFRVATRWQLRQARTVFVQTEELKDLVQAFYGPLRVVVVPNGVDVPPARADVDRRAHHGRLKCIYVGSTDTYHDIAGLLRVSAKMGGIVELTIVGSGENVDEYRKEYSAFTNIRFLGSLSYDSALREMQEADVGLAAYNLSMPLFAKYGFYFCPLKLLEYSGAGIPTILIGMSNSFVRIFEESSACSVVSGVGDLERALQYLVKDPGRVEEMGKRAYETVQRFTWEATARNTLMAMNDS